MILSTLPTPTLHAQQFTHIPPCTVFWQRGSLDLPLMGCLPVHKFLQGVLCSMPER